jgi:predicted ATPase
VLGRSAGAERTTGITGCITGCAGSSRLMLTRDIYRSGSFTVPESAREFLNETIIKRRQWKITDVKRET